MEVEKVKDAVGGMVPQGETFHWKDGWLFCRGEANDVHIWNANHAGKPDAVELKIPATEWASIVRALA